MKFWRQVTKFDKRACELADRHYSRRKVGSPQFMPPGQTIVMLADAAVWGWWRPHPDSGLESMNGLDGWTCTIFRNEGAALSSELVLDAEQAIAEAGYDCGPDGLLTYVWDKKVRSTNPGYCFKMAGWKAIGRSADGKKTLLQKPCAVSSRVEREDIPGARAEALAELRRLRDLRTTWYGAESNDLMHALNRYLRTSSGEAGK